jgi:hypothetical protein
MSEDRRLRRYLITLHQVVGLLRGTLRVSGGHLPADAVPVSGHWNADHGAFAVLVHSAAFDPVPVGLTIPIHNAPQTREIDPCSRTT